MLMQQCYCGQNSDGSLEEYLDAFTQRQTRLTRLCLRCKSGLKAKQLRLVQGVHTQFRLIDVKDKKQQRRSILDVIPTEKDGFLFHLASIGHSAAVIDALSFLLVDLRTMILLYSFDEHEIYLSYDSNFCSFYGEWCYTHTLKWIDDVHCISLQREHAENGYFTYLYWSCKDIENDEKSIELDPGNWPLRLNLEKLCFCPHRDFLHAVSTLLVCLPDSAWEYRE